MKKVTRPIIIILILCGIAAAALTVAVLYDSLREPPSPVVDAPDSETLGQGDTEDGEPPVIMERFTELYAQNSDLVGWIRVPNTVIDYPVVSGIDNAFYLNHDFNKNPYSGGAPFLDMNADLLEKNQSLSLYGHYLNNGEMFTALHNYKELDYYKSYPVFHFDSLYENGIFKIFSVFYMAGNMTDEYFYYYPVSSFDSDEAFMKHVDRLLARSIFVTGVDVAPGDQLVLMTCCTYETDNLRLVIAGRKMRPDESFAVDTRGAYLNPQPLYPKKWYDKKGGEPPPLPDR